MSTTVFRSELSMADISDKDRMLFVIETHDKKPNIQFRFQIFDEGGINIAGVKIYRHIEPSALGAVVKTFTTDDNINVKPALSLYMGGAFPIYDDNLWCDFAASKLSDYQTEFSLKLKENETYGLVLLGASSVKTDIPVGLTCSWTED